MKNLIQQSYVPKSNEIKKWFDKWLGQKTQTAIAHSFLKMPTQAQTKKYRSITSIPFNAFDFSKKNSFYDLTYDLKLEEFLQWTLEKTSPPEYERKVRWHYTKRDTLETINNSITYFRALTREKFGFGAYQIKTITEQRMCDDGEYHTYNPIVLIPTNPSCIEKIKSSNIENKKEILAELKERNKYLLRVWKHIKANVKKELGNQKEIKKALRDWEQEE
jgi:hypothetical protein